MPILTVPSIWIPARSKGKFSAPHLNRRILTPNLKPPLFVTNRKETPSSPGKENPPSSPREPGIWRLRWATDGPMKTCPRRVYRGGNKRRLLSNGLSVPISFPDWPRRPPRGETCTKKSRSQRLHSPLRRHSCKRKGVTTQNSQYNHEEFLSSHKSLHPLNFPTYFGIQLKYSEKSH